MVPWHNGHCVSKILIEKGTITLHFSYHPFLSSSDKFFCLLLSLLFLTPFVEGIFEGSKEALIYR